MNSEKTTNAVGVQPLVSQTSGDDGKLSPKQIENWRRVLTMMIGPYALIMPDEEVQRHRDAMQRQADKLSG